MRIADTTQRTIHTLQRTWTRAHILITSLVYYVFFIYTQHVIHYTTTSYKFIQSTPENVLIFLRYALYAYVYLFFCVLSNILIFYCFFSFPHRRSIAAVDIILFSR